MVKFILVRGNKAVMYKNSGRGGDNVEIYLPSRGEYSQPDPAER